MLGFFIILMSLAPAETPVQQQQQERGSRLTYNASKQLLEQPSFLEGSANSWLMFSIS